MDLICISESRWLDLLDKVERMGNMSLPVLRKYADGDKTWGRGKCIAEELDTDFRLLSTPPEE